jgi:hypothetical protein
MALQGISPHEHNRLLDRLTRRTDDQATMLANYRKLVDLYSRYNNLIGDLEAVIGEYHKAAAPVRARQMNTGVGKVKSADILNR